MNNSPEWLALKQAYAVCSVHDGALRDALVDLKQRGLSEIFSFLSHKIRERFTGMEP